MPVKKRKTHHHSPHDKGSHTKKYRKVYWPYLPLLVAASLGIVLVIGISLN